jgi:hypothetical protein
MNEELADVLHAAGYPGFAADVRSGEYEPEAILQAARGADAILPPDRPPLAPIVEEWVE